jgi:hypothetical protein
MPGPAMQHGFFAAGSTNSSPMTMSSPLDGTAALIGNGGRNSADACDTNASETNVEATVNLTFVARSMFTEVQTPFRD